MEGHFFKELQNRVEMFESEEFPGVKETDIAAFVDPRTSAVGVRVLCAEDSFEFAGAESDGEDDLEIETDAAKYYDLFRMALGLPEGASEMSN